METIVVVALFAFLGGIIQTVLGFGAGLIMMMALPYLFSMLQASSLSASITLFLSLTLTLRFRKHIRWDVALVPTIVYTLVSSLVILVADKLKMNILALGFGFFLIFIALQALLQPPKKDKEKVTLKKGLLYAGVSGFFSGLFSVGGPYNSVYFISSTDTKEEFIGSIQMLFTVNVVVSFITRIYKGFYTPDLIPYTLCGMVAILLGQIIGLRVLKKLNIALLKKIVYTGVGIAGAITVVQQTLKMV